MAVALACLPVTAAALSRNYLCFFAADDATPSARCRGVLAEFAAHWQRMAAGTEVPFYGDRTALPPVSHRIEVHGHDDKSNSQPKAHQIALRRALAVADEIVRLGVPPEFITVIGFDNASPLVPTDQPEPQNRRVQLVLR
jgi:outer membrane protein OmpA-like peptidoglycan-associated protein